MNATSRAVLYARVSTEDQARYGYSLPSQIEKSREYADSRGWLVVAAIQDDGVSGATLDRPGLDRVRALADDEEFDVLVVYELDRLSRKAVHQMILEEELERNGVRVHYVLGGYDNSDEGRLQKGIRAQIAEYERAKIKERCMRGRRAKAKSGRVVGHGRGTYGYRYSDDRYVVEESEARIIRMIFQWYLEGESIRGVERCLNGLGVPSWDGSLEWAHSTVSKILSNETYAGTFYHNRFRAGTRITHELRPREEWIPVSVPPIIGRDVWEAVQVRRNRRRDRVRRRPTRQYLLRGVMTCIVCGRVYSGEYAKEKRYYRDGGRKHRSLRADAIEGAAWQGLCRILTDHESLSAGWRDDHAKADSERVLIQKQMADCGALRARAVAKIENLNHTYLDPDIPMSKEEYLGLRTLIQRELDGADEQCRKLQARLDATTITEQQIQSLKQFVDDVQEGLAEASFDLKRLIVETLQLTGEVEWVDKDVAEIRFTGAIPSFGVRLSSTIF